MKHEIKENPHPINVLSLVGICSGCIVMGLVFAMVNASIPVIQQALAVPLHLMQWMMMAFGIINCALLVTSGRLADMFGRKKIYLFGLSSSGLGMLLGGFSQGGVGLIVSMSLAGLGNAILLPVSQAMLVSEFPETLKSRAIALWATAIAYAMALGPIVGGVISKEWGWRWIFWSMIPFFIISFFLIALFSKESKNTVDPPIGDYWGMTFLGVGLTAFVLLTTEFNRFSRLTNGILFLLTMGAFIALWRNSRRFPYPILLPELVRKRVFIAASVASACLIFYIWATFFLLPIYLQNVRYLSPLSSGLIMLAITVPVIILSPIVGRRYHPHKAWLFSLIGFIFLLISSILQGGFGEASSVVFIVITTLFFGVGYGLIYGPTATAAISVVPPYKAGIASGTYVTFQEIGGTLGLALVVTTVRLYSPLSVGFQKGGVGLIFISILGCIASLLLKRQKSN
ncbi:MAG: MFS transporter [Simkaniaceae bacterium]